MRRSRKHRSRSGAVDVFGTVGVDLFMAFGGVVLVLLIAALCAMGVPQVTWSEFESELKRRQWAESWATNAVEALAKESKERAAAENGRRQAERRSADAERELESERERREAAENAVKRRPVDVAIAIDCTGSMASMIAEVRSCIDILAVVGPALCPEFRLSVVAYRSDVAVLALTALEGKGLQRWKTFAYEKTVRTEVKENLSDRVGRIEMLPHLSAVNSLARIDIGIRRALRELPSASKNRHRVLIVAGDVGPWETGDMGTVEFTEQRTADAVVGEVERFAEEENSTVLALFTGSQNHEMHLRAETRRFLKRLAGTEGTYSERPSEITASVLRASLVPGTER